MQQRLGFAKQWVSSFWLVLAAVRTEHNKFVAAAIVESSLLNLAWPCRSALHKQRMAAFSCTWSSCLLFKLRSGSRLISTSMHDLHMGVPWETLPEEKLGKVLSVRWHQKCQSDEQVDF